MFREQQSTSKFKASSPSSCFLSSAGPALLYCFVAFIIFITQALIILTEICCMLSQLLSLEKKETNNIREYKKGKKVTVPPHCRYCLAYSATVVALRQNTVKVLNRVSDLIASLKHIQLHGLLFKVKPATAVDSISFAIT